MVSTGALDGVSELWNRLGAGDGLNRLGPTPLRSLLALRNRSDAMTFIFGGIGGQMRVSSEDGFQTQYSVRRLPWL